MFAIDGEIGSGWIFPSNPGQLNVKDQSTGHGTGWGATAGPPPPQYNVYFTFVPARIASYSLTAVFAFHGFYVLKADDGFFTHKYAQVRLDIAMDVNQFVDIGWKSFPSPINRDESNVNEVKTYDLTHFFDYTTVLKEGDPVVVTVRLTLDALASGSGSYAEINFDTGVSNYIEPLFLSVGPG